MKNALILAITVTLSLPALAFSDPAPTNPKLLSGNPSIHDYPKAALKQRLEGMTSMNLYITKSGKLSTCEITESSGHSILDQASCRMMAFKARFSPAKDINGENVAAILPHRINWTLPK